MELTVIALIFVIIVLVFERLINKKQNNGETEKQEENNNIIDYSTLYQKKEYILTQNELKFYKLLKYITDKNNLIIFTQVSLYEILKAKNYSDFNRIKSKSIDFVITDINSKIKICIELDDPTHIREDRQQRDKFINELFKQLGIKLLRVPVQSYYNMQEIEQKIKESL